MSATKSGIFNGLMYSEHLRKTRWNSGGTEGGGTDGSRTTESGQDPVSRTTKGTDLAQGGLAKSQQLMPMGQVASKDGINRFYCAAKISWLGLLGWKIVFTYLQGNM